MTALRVRGLTKSYGPELALDDFDLDVDAGDAVALIGPNGSGKTTALRTIAGRLEADDGSVRVGRLDPETDRSEVRRRLVYVSDTPVLFDDLTLAEHMEFVGVVFGVENAEERGDDLLERFRLDHRRDDLPTTFSRGMRQRAQLCTAFLRPADVMLIDEPFVGLDPAGMRTLVDLCLERKRDGLALVVATHVLAAMELFCDRVVVLADGVVLRESPVGELRPAEGTPATTDPFDEVFLSLLDAGGLDTDDEEDASDE